MREVADNILNFGITIMPFEWSWNYGIANYFRYLTSTLELTIPSFRKASKHNVITDYQHIKILDIRVCIITITNSK
jgi:hypothetical protein